MATKKKKKTPAKKAIVAAPASPPAMNPKEQALADLASSFATMTSGCYELHRDGRLGVADQTTWWILGTAGVRVMMRFDGAWTRIIGNNPPTLADLTQLDAVTDIAVETIRRAKQIPSQNRLAIATAATASAIDAVDAMIDVAAKTG